MPPAGTSPPIPFKIEWDDFFQTFDERKLAFLYQDKTKDGGTSRFFKFVRR